MRRTTLFTKQPVPWRVKTRLVPPLDPSEAAALAEAMLLDLWERCASCEGFQGALRFAPEGAESWFREHLPSLADQAPQRGADLAERLASHFAGLRPGDTEVVIGGDAPLLPLATMLAAHVALEQGADLALSLDGGGGYTLVGLRAPHPELFLEVTMSDPEMGARTVELARAAGLDVALLPTSTDVDTWSDVLALSAALEQVAPSHPELPERTQHLVQRLLQRHQS